MGESFDPYLKWFGIPLKDRPIHHYRLLGIEVFESDVEVIENAADQRMAHLKRFGTGKHSALAENLLNEVAAARICLLNPTKKAKYDEELRGRLGGQESAVPSAAALPGPRRRRRCPSRCPRRWPSHRLGPWTTRSSTSSKPRWAVPRGRFVLRRRKRSRKRLGASSSQLPWDWVRSSPSSSTRRPGMATRGLPAGPWPVHPG